MSKVYVQATIDVWSASAPIALAGSVTSGSFITQGYTRLLGILYTDASAKAGSGLRIAQSANWGVNWDYNTDFAPSASSGSAYSIEIVGNAAKIDYITDSAASIFRTAWYLRPV